jgi:two-component system NtrC family sensor kinase
VALLPIADDEWVIGLVRRILPSLGIVAVGIVLSATIFTMLRSLESKNAETSFNGVAQERLDDLETNLTLTLDNLVTVGALFDASHEVEREEFGRFTVPLLARNHAIQALEWIPRVPKRSRRKYEEEVRHGGFRSFEFTERLSSVQMVRAGEREEYFPVFFVAPFQGNEKALGFDLASDPVRRQALQSSADSGQMVATNRIKLVQETSDQYGFLVFRPVYRGGVEPPTTEGRREELTGFALAVFRVAAIVEAGAVPSSTSDLSLAIFDRDAILGERLLYPKGAHLDGVGDLPRNFRVTRTIVVAGRTWELAAYPLGHSFRPARWSSSAAFLVGLLLTCLLTAHLAERRHAEEALQQSEERARLLFATIPHPAFVFDTVTLEFLEVNEAAVQQYGYSREEFLNMKATDIRPAEDVERFCGRLQQAPFAKGCAEQSKHVSKDGRIIYVEVHSHSFDYNGRKFHIAIAQDVTERNRLEIDLRHAQKLEAVGRLAAGIAHEINTPIQFVGDNIQFLHDAFADLSKVMEKYRCLSAAAANGVAGMMLADEVAEAEMAVDINYLVEEIPKAIAQSLDGVARVATLVRAMKEFAHPDRKERAAADINAALLSTLTVARNELKYVADVETELGDLPLAVCNIGELNQVFLNLLVNAAHAIGDAVNGTGQKGVIRVRTSIEEDAVLISIADTGCGIPEDIRDKIFDPFFTTKESGRGTGQGLAIARSVVVDKHGGTLTFASEVGKGTTFFIRLPLDEEVKSEEEKPS